MGEPGLLLIGLSHRTAAVETRERCAVPAEELVRRLQAVTALADVREAWLVSTCNRTELLVVVGSEAPADDERVLGALHELVFRAASGDALYRYRGAEAVLHLFRVAAGLDSLILGESQILAQVKEATRSARDAKTLGPTLESLLRLALVAGKRVRAETSVGEGTLSVAKAGVDVARHVVGRFTDARVLILGAGETGRLVARHLSSEGGCKLTFANRSLERAAEVAGELNGRAASLDDLPGLIAESDVLFACVDGAPDLVRREHVKKKALAHRDRPLVLVDLSVPRAIEPALRELSQVVAYDLDDLARIVARNQEARQRAGEEAAPILLAEAHKFLGLHSYASFAPLVARLRQRFDQTREAELDVVAGPNASAEMVQLAHRLARHLLDVALDELKASARESIDTDPLGRALQRFFEQDS